MKKSSHHIALSFLAVAVTLLVATSYVYMYYHVGTSFERVALANEIVEIQRLHKSREKDLVNNYETSVADRKKLIGFFVPSDSTVQFIEAIESLGPISGSEVELSSIEAVPPEKDKINAQGSVRAHIEVHGGWSAVMKTLMLAESLPYSVNINQVRLDTSIVISSPAKSTPISARNSAREWRLSFDIQINTIAPPLADKL